MHFQTAIVSLALLAGMALPAAAAMPVAGADAPSIPALQSVIGGNYEPFDLKAASTGKAIVLYFFPEAFTEG